MQVRVSAFDIDIDSDSINLDSLIDFLTEINGIQLEDRREYYFDDQSFPGFCAGVIITIKDQKNYCTLVEDDTGSPVIKVNGLAEGSAIMDFNFFAINMANGIGVYQHYHQSAAISSLEKRIKFGLKELKNQLIANEIAVETTRKGSALTKIATARINRKHKSLVKVRTLVSRETLRALLAKYAKIKGMEYSYTTLLPVVRNATPLGARVEKKKEVISFSNPSIVATLSREINEAIADYDIAKGRIFVEDANGLNDVIKIFDMPEELWERDYDDVVALIDNINVSDFGNNQFLGAMIDLFKHKDYAHVLQADPI
ncbi:hypothetical protein ACQKFS_15675 [Pseudomonas guineae]|uniref:hypothetical protein n=1 Tax=Pseudomonas guineae TaxID=425504 RepID=UPI003D074BF4